MFWSVCARNIVWNCVTLDDVEMGKSHDPALPPASTNVSEGQNTAAGGAAGSARARPLSSADHGASRRHAAAPLSPVPGAADRSPGVFSMASGKGSNIPAESSQGAKIKEEPGIASAGPVETERPRGQIDPTASSSNHRLRGIPVGLVLAGSVVVFLVGVSTVVWGLFGSLAQNSRSSKRVGAAEQHATATARHAVKTVPGQRLQGPVKLPPSANQGRQPGRSASDGLSPAHRMDSMVRPATSPTSTEPVLPGASLADLAPTNGPNSELVGKIITERGQRQATVRRAVAKPSAVPHTPPPAVERRIKPRAASERLPPAAVPNPREGHSVATQSVNEPWVD